MSIRFKVLTIKNFLSYGAVPTTIILDVNGSTLILGEDLDNTSSGTGANGTGKSGIINALSYAIYDRPISNISKDNLVNNINKGNMEVTLEFEKDDINYVIKRARKTKSGAAGNHVHFYVDQKDVTLDSVANTNNLIENVVGFPFELFIRVAAISANHVPFLDLPVRSHYAANQTDIIEELFDLKTLSDKAVSLKGVIKETEQAIDILNTRNNQLVEERERLETLTNSTKKRFEKWVNDNTNTINLISSKLDTVSNIDVEHQKSLIDKASELRQLLEDKSSEHTLVNKEISKRNKKIKTLSEEINHLNDDKCPYCLQKYPNTEQKINEISNELSNLKSEVETLSDNQTTLSRQIDVIAIEIKTIEQQITVEDISELIQIKSDIHHYHQQLEDLKQLSNPYREQLEELQNMKTEDVDMKKMNELSDLLTHQKFLYKLLTKKDSFVRKALLNKNIPFLNSRLDHYLNELGLPHTVEFTHEMTASISQFGRPMDFGNLSNGQRARVNLALSFAFRDVLQSIHGHINICMLDEILDVGLDAIGVQSAARMIKRKARDESLSIFIISHRDEIDSAFDRKMIVQMSKGFSNIIFEE